MTDHGEDRKSFEAWFGTPLTALMNEDNAGLIVAMVAFPLLERYLQRKSGASSKKAPFKKALMEFLPELKNSRQNAKDFWENYRNGLLHHVMSEDWLSHETTILERSPRGFVMNPVLFAERVLEKIRADFATFAKEPAFPAIENLPMVSTDVSPQYTVLSTGGRG